jgi:putative transposase
MPQFLSRVWLHVTFSTKERRAYLQREDFCDEMLSLLCHQIERAGCVAVRTGGWVDHVHLVCGLSRTVTIASLVEHVKTETSKWAKLATHGSATFSWQSGYGAFSVSQSNMIRSLTMSVARQSIMRSSHSKRNSANSAAGMNSNLMSDMPATKGPAFQASRDVLEILFRGRWPRLANVPAPWAS